MSKDVASLVVALEKNFLVGVQVLTSTKNSCVLKHAGTESVNKC